MTTLAEMRQKVDDVDERIIKLLAERAQYVRHIAEIKGKPDSVIAPEREQQVYATRRAWAEANNLDPDAIEELYRLIVAYFSRFQQELLSAREE